MLNIINFLANLIFNTIETKIIGGIFELLWNIITFAALKMRVILFNRRINANNFTISTKRKSQNYQEE